MTDKPEDSEHTRRLEELLPLFEAYNCTQGGGREYVNTHWRRYLYTADLIPRDRPLRILELGASGPFAFTAMLASRLHPGSSIVLVHEPVPGESPTLALPSTDPRFPSLQFESRGFNIELDRWPFSDSSFDIVLLMEVLEHLFWDPFVVFTEARRVLVEGGQFIVTTPNIASFPSLQALLELKSPYTHGAYSVFGPSARHNREFVPPEVDALGSAAGFSRVLLTTRDFYNVTSDVPRLSAILSSFAPDRDLVHDLRAQTIIWVGAANGSPGGSPPEFLFDQIPEEHLCEIHLIGDVDRSQPGKLNFRLRLRNKGKLKWKTDPADPTRLGIQLLDQQGQVTSLDFARHKLHQDVSPGQTLEVLVSLNENAVAAAAFLRFDMVHENVSWFARYGHFNKPLDVPLR